MIHVDQAVKNEGQILSALDKELIPLTYEQRQEIIEDLTIKEAREANERFVRELERLDAVKKGIIETRQHLTGIVGAGNHKPGMR